MNNTYVKINNKWQVYEKAPTAEWHRNLKWHEWFDLRFVQLRDWLHLLGKEK